LLLFDALRLEQPVCLAFYGARGKQSAIFQLGRELLEQRPADQSGKQAVEAVLITAAADQTSNRISLADIHIQLDDKTLSDEILTGEMEGLVLITGPLSKDGSTTAGLSPDAILKIHETATKLGVSLLIDTDSSTGSPMKAADSIEPDIPVWTDVALAIGGISAIGKPLSAEWVANPDRFGEVVGLSQGEMITSEHFAAFLCHPAGGLNGVPVGMRRIALIDQVDSPYSFEVAQELARSCLSSYQSVVLVNFDQCSQKYKQQSPVAAIYEPVAAIILAAGLSRRMKQPKLALPWGDTTVIGQIVQQILESGIKEILVVSGGAHQEIIEALVGKPVRIIFNPDFAASEMLDSIKLGLRNVSHFAQAALIVLGDQPQLQVRTIKYLTNAYAIHRPSLVVPSFKNHRGHPWLVDRRLWPSILAVEPLNTLRSFLNENRSEICYIDSPDDTILRDLDTPADYEREQKLF
jgi:molybdenum cofactor cytidylyltransferase